MLKDNLENEIKDLLNIKENLKCEIIQLDDELLYQEFGLFQPQYKFSNIDKYKDVLSNVRQKQKEMIKLGHAAICNREWIVDGSETKGKKMISDTIKEMIRVFNIESDFTINKTKFHNYENSKMKILKSWESINLLNETKSIELSYDYLQLKLNELNISYEYYEARQVEKELQQHLREERKQEELLIKEIELKRIEYQKEYKHYQLALSNIEIKIDSEQDDEMIDILINRKNDLIIKVNDSKLALEDLDYREANQKAGYVYIISNIGAFGEDVYKIGMTRRLDPMERISELSGASVPFKFDVHAMIFSDDAPKLEATLHKQFETNKLNQVNGRKEFFKIKLNEIKKVINEFHDKSVEFIDIPEAQQYRETLILINNDISRKNNI